MEYGLLGWPKILKILKINKADPRCIFYGLTESKNINKSFWECFSTLPKAFQKYKGSFKKYKGKMWKLVFYHFEPLNLFKTCLMTLVCIPEVLTHLLTPILPYVYITNVGWHMRQIWHFWHFWHKWRIWHLTFVMYRYGNMGVKRCVRTSGMQSNAIKQVLNRFKGSKW